MMISILDIKSPNIFIANLNNTINMFFKRYYRAYRKKQKDKCEEWKRLFLNLEKEIKQITPREEGYTYYIIYQLKGRSYEKFKGTFIYTRYCQLKQIILENQI